DRPVVIRNGIERNGAVIRRQGDDGVRALRLRVAREPHRRFSVWSLDADHRGSSSSRCPKQDFSPPQALRLGEHVELTIELRPNHALRPCLDAKIQFTLEVVLVHLVAESKRSLENREDAAESFRGSLRRHCGNKTGTSEQRRRQHAACGSEQKIPASEFIFHGFSAFNLYRQCTRSQRASCPANPSRRWWNARAGQWESMCGKPRSSPESSRCLSETPCTSALGRVMTRLLRARLSGFPSTV